MKKKLSCMDILRLTSFLNQIFINQYLDHFIFITFMGNQQTSEQLQTKQNTQNAPHKTVQSLQEAYAYKSPHNINQRFPEIMKKVQIIKKREKFAGILFSIEQCPVYYLKTLGCYYQGQWEDGLPHGCGIAIYQNQSYYEGDFNHGQIETLQGFFYFNNAPDKLSLTQTQNSSKSKTKAKSPNLDIQEETNLDKSSYYIGQFSASKFHGKGRIYHKGVYYNGDWINGKRQGQGKQYDLSSYNFQGKFFNGLKNQYGIYTRRLNNKIYIYQGEFKLGKFNGNGKITIDNRQYFSGIFMNGKAEGKGQINLKLGIFKGLFKSNLINGEGQFTYLQEQLHKKQGIFHEKIINGNQGEMRKLCFQDQQLTEEEYIIFPIFLASN